MTPSNIIGTLGVSLLLIAFVLNQRRMISEHSRAFLVMNMIGALLCGYSAWLVRFMPFVVLETVWALFAAWGLLRWSPEPSENSESNITPERGVAHTIRRIPANSASDDLSYWNARSIIERIDAALDIRNEYHGTENETEQRLERILTRIERR